MTREKGLLQLGYADLDTEQTPIVRNLQGSVRERVRALLMTAAAESKLGPAAARLASVSAGAGVLLNTWREMHGLVLIFAAEAQLKCSFCLWALRICHHQRASSWSSWANNLGEQARLFTSVLRQLAQP